MRRMISIVGVVAMGTILVSGVMAEEEGLLQRMYKKYVKKEDAVKKEPAKPAPAKTSSAASKTAANAEQKDVQGGAREVQAAVPKKDLTKEEMIAEIREELSSDEDILGLMPDIKKEKGADGKDDYLFVVDGQAKKLEDLDKELVGKIYARVHQTATKLRTDRINKQLENIRNLQQIQQMQQTLRTQTQTVPQVPRVPSQPAAAAQVPRAPTVPASAPRR